MIALPVPGLDGAFTPKKVQLIQDGTDCLLVSMGAVSNEAAAAVTKLSNSGLSCAHAVLATINPAPDESFIELLGPLSYGIHY